MKSKIDIASLKEYYLVANTATYLYNKFVADESILTLVIHQNTFDLVQEFLKVINIEINEIDDLVYAYSLYVAIILKNDDTTYEFMQNEGDVNFEWFIELRSLYFSRYRATMFYSFEGDSSALQLQKKYNTESKSVNEELYDLS